MGTQLQKQVAVMHLMTECKSQFILDGPHIAIHTILYSISNLNPLKSMDLVWGNLAQYCTACDDLEALRSPGECVYPFIPCTCNYFPQCEPTVSLIYVNRAYFSINFIEWKCHASQLLSQKQMLVFNKHFVIKLGPLRQNFMERHSKLFRWDGGHVSFIN